MIQDHHSCFADPTPAPQIDALLCMSDRMSIVDRLMALPRATENDSETEWDRGVANRLQVKLSGMMKEQLTEPVERKKAA